MIFSPPAEIEFLERGFGLSIEHDPDEAVASYCRDYQDGTELVVMFTGGSVATACARISRIGRPIAEVAVENVTEVSFQSWHGSKALRMRFNQAHLSVYLRVDYDPHAGVHMVLCGGVET